MRACVRACSNANRKLPYRFVSFIKEREKKERKGARLLLNYYSKGFDISLENPIRTKQYRLDEAEFQSSSGIFNLNGRKRKGWMLVAHFEKRKYQSSVASDHRIIVAQLSGNADYPHGRCGFKSASHFDDGNRRGLRRGVDTGAGVYRAG